MHRRETSQFSIVWSNLSEDFTNSCVKTTAVEFILLSVLEPYCFDALWGSRKKKRKRIRQWWYVEMFHYHLMTVNSYWFKVWFKVFYRLHLVSFRVNFVWYDLIWEKSLFDKMIKSLSYLVVPVLKQSSTFVRSPRIWSASISIDWYRATHTNQEDWQQFAGNYFD